MSIEKKGDASPRTLAKSEMAKVVGGYYTSRNLTYNVSATQGCFIAGTKIRLASGEWIAVEDTATLAPGAFVVSRHDGKPAKVEFGRFGPEPIPLYSITTVDGSTIGVTEYHPMIVRSPEGIALVPAKDLKVSDELLIYSPGERSFVRIRTVELKMYDGNVYNFAIEGGDELESHMIVANGFVTGDLVLQERLTPERAPVKEHAISRS